MRNRILEVQIFVSYLMEYFHVNYKFMHKIFNIFVSFRIYSIGVIDNKLTLRIPICVSRHTNILVNLKFNRNYYKYWSNICPVKFYQSSCVN